MNTENCFEMNQKTAAPDSYAVGFEETPLSEMLTAAAQIDGVDIALALGRISGKQKVLEACIEQTCNSTGEKLKKMSICLSAHDLHGFSIEAHGLKVAFAEIGATGHSALASDLERASKAGDTQMCKKRFIEFAGLAKALASELNAIIPTADPGTKNKGDCMLLFKVAKEASELLNCFETDDALNCLAQLDTYTFGEETDALLNYIKTKVKAYKYDDAILTLKSIFES